METKLHLALDAHDMAVRAFITEDTTTNCTEAKQLIEGFEGQHTQYKYDNK